MFKKLFHRKDLEEIKRIMARIDSEGRFGKPQVTAIKETKIKEKILICYSQEFDDYVQIRIFLSNGTASNFINLTFRDTTMNIADIQVLGKENISRGYGSILMDQALSIARTKGIKTVTGLISSEDEENRIRQVNFYQKYGFSIKNNELSLEL